MQDALFLYQHPSWSQRDLNDADQDLIDILEAFDVEGAKLTRDERRRNDAKARAAARRSR